MNKPQIFQVLDELDPISIEKRKDFKEIAKYVHRILGVITSAPRVEIKASIADAVAMKTPGIIGVTSPLNNLWGWFLSSLRGKLYRKILTRAIVADNEFVSLEKRVKEFWEL